MSLLPFIVSLSEDQYDPWPQFSSWHHQPVFSMLQQPRTTGGYQRNWCLANNRPCGASECLRKHREPPTIGKEGFQVSLDVHQFAPNEISVKTVDHSLVIEGKHEEKRDNEGFVSRHFVRRYELPQEFDVQQVVSSLSSDGVLTVKAPPPALKEAEGRERIIQIQQTGPAHLSVKHNEEKDGEEKKEEPKK